MTQEVAAGFIAAEHREKGKISRSAYKNLLEYIPAGKYVIPFLVVFLASESIGHILFRWFAELWITGCESTSACVAPQTLEDTLRAYFHSAGNEGTFKFMLLFCIGVFIFSSSNFALIYTLYVLGVLKIHRQMVEGLAGVRVTFFDENPSGRLINRFSGDINELVDEVGWVLIDVAYSVISIGIIFATISIKAPLLSLFAVFGGFFYFYLFKSYLPSAREIRRINKIGSSPIWALFTETLSGYQVIRGHNKVDVFVGRFQKLYKSYGSGLILGEQLLLWLQSRVYTFSECVGLGCSLFSIWAVAQGHFSVATMGFLMSLVIGLDGAMYWLLVRVGALESSMVSVERVLEYQNLPVEPETFGGISADWAGVDSVRGRITFAQLEMSYRPDLERVLKGLNVDIPAGKRVGVIGRTGAGKSSLFQCLYRMVHFRRGRVQIDGIDITQIPLNELRDIYGIVPQEPHLFSGTLRSNLDRSERFSDDAIWQALEAVSLQDFVMTLPGKLGYSLLEKGSNLSVGQRQLLCMARAILRDAKIILMDEATASVDLETDEKIHKATHKAFAGKTLLIIAHRLETVEDCDFILHIDGGKVLDFAPPAQVLARFRQKQKEGGLRDVLS